MTISAKCHATVGEVRVLCRTSALDVPVDSPLFHHLTLMLLALLLLFGRASAQYVPPAGSWERRTPSEVGLDTTGIRAAIEFARAHQSSDPRDLVDAHYRTFAREPFGEPIGPLKTRGEQTGIILKNGYIVAEWGEPERVDMTFSVTKSFLSTVVGLAWADGRIRSVDDPVAPYLPPVLLPDGDGEPGSVSQLRMGARSPVYLFSSEHNRKITWDNLLRQTSDWEGTLWGKPDWSDRPAKDPNEWLTRERSAPGTVFEYNDVRVNLLALAATLVWRKPLQEVLREKIMRPIGASPTWQWYGYENSWILLDGVEVQVPSGGGHWGGGMFISAYDLARFGLLTTRHYRWGDTQLIPQEWWKKATTPTEANPGYGFMNFYLNTGRKGFASAPESAWIHLGSGANVIYCDPEHDVVIVVRWIDARAMDEVVKNVLEAIE